MIKVTIKKMWASYGMDLLIIASVLSVMRIDTNRANAWVCMYKYACACACLWNHDIMVKIYLICRPRILYTIGSWILVQRRHTITTSPLEMQTEKIRVARKNWNGDSFLEIWTWDCMVWTQRRSPSHIRPLGTNGAEKGPNETSEVHSNRFEPWSVQN